MQRDSCPSLRPGCSLPPSDSFRRRGSMSPLETEEIGRVSSSDSANARSQSRDSTPATESSQTSSPHIALVNASLKAGADRAQTRHLGEWEGPTLV
eukprot:3449305-Rhodomonas_salina.1